MYLALLPYRRTVDARKQQRGAAEELSRIASEDITPDGPRI
jgi:hypothetical protein